MKFNFINFAGALILILMLLPNFIYALRFRDARNECTIQFINAAEQVGRFSAMALMVLPLGVREFGFPSVEAMLIYVFGNGALLLAYLVCWTFYFRQQSLGIAMALAALPTCIFLLSGLTLGHWLLAAAAILFGAAHGYITYRNNRD